MIQRASVVGRVFSLDAVSALTREVGPHIVETHLQALIRKELIRPERSPYLGEDGFRFRHHLIRDAAYQSMPKQARADMHERFADMARAGGRAGSRRPRRADRLPPRAGVSLPVGDRAVVAQLDDRTRAAARLASAGEGPRPVGRVRDAFDLAEDMPATVNLLTRAASLMGENPERLELLPDLAKPSSRRASSGGGSLARGDHGRGQAV